MYFSGFFADELNETEEEMLVLIIKTFKIFNCVTCFSLGKKAQQIHILTDLIRQLALHCFQSVVLTQVSVMGFVSLHTLVAARPC